MKTIGLIIVFLSIAFAVWAFNFDTSVYSDTGQKVNNLGLMNRQQNYIIASGFVFIAGILMLVFGDVKKLPKS